MGKVRADMAKNLRCRLRVPRAGRAWGQQIERAEKKTK